MTTHIPMTLQSTIDVLERLVATIPEISIEGLSADVTQYGGYYEHTAVAPGEQVLAADLLDELRAVVGEDARDGYVFVAEHGVPSGLHLSGFVLDWPVKRLAGVTLTQRVEL